MVKLLVVGLDGTDFGLLGQWIQNGDLPYFRKLLDNGVRGGLEKTIPPMTAVVIPSFCSGRNPGKIGVHGFTKGGKLVTSRDLPKDTIWAILSRNGFRSAVINVPLTYPAQALNGYMLSDSRYIPSKESDYAYPPQLRDMAHDYPIENPGAHPERFVDKEGYFNAPAVLQKLIDDMEIRFDIAGRILKKEENIDFLLLYIIETDTLHHHIWTRKEEVLSFYRRLDSKLRQLVEENDCRNIIIFSDHGNEKYPDYYFNINSWLKKEGLLTLRKRSLANRIMSAAYALSEKANIFRKTGYRIGKLIFKDQQLGTRPPDIDWKSTLAFSKSFGITLFRENIGSEEEYERVRNSIIRKMMTITGVDDETAIGEIYKREELYWGDKVNEFPDILFLTNGYFPNVIHYSENIFEKMSERERKNREGAILEGTHVTSFGANALLIASGENFGKGKEIKNTNTYDIAPTILHMFDIPIPRAMDGRVLREIFKQDGKLAQRQVRYHEPDAEQERLRSRIKEMKESGRL